MEKVEAERAVAFRRHRSKDDRAWNNCQPNDLLRPCSVPAPWLPYTLYSVETGDAKRPTHDLEVVFVRVLSVLGEVGLAVQLIRPVWVQAWCRGGVGHASLKH